MGQYTMSTFDRKMQNALDSAFPDKTWEQLRKEINSYEREIEKAEASVTRIEREGKTCNNCGPTKTFGRLCDGNCAYTKMGQLGSLKQKVRKRREEIAERIKVPTWERPSEWGMGTGRRLAGCSDHDAPSDWLIFAPILLILMLVFFIHRRRIQSYFSGAAMKPSYGGLRIRKKAAHMTLSY